MGYRLYYIHSYNVARIPHHWDGDARAGVRDAMSQDEKRGAGENHHGWGYNMAIQWILYIYVYILDP